MGFESTELDVTAAAAAAAPKKAVPGSLESRLRDYLRRSFRPVLDRLTKKFVYVSQLPEGETGLAASDPFLLASFQFGLRSRSMRLWGDLVLVY